MDMPHTIILQKNHVYLKEKLRVDPLLDALYEKCIFTQEDYEHCRDSGRGKCEVFLETLRRKGVEGYKVFCAALEKSQPFIKERLDATASKEGHSDLIYVNKDKLEAQFKKQIDERDGQIAEPNTEKEGLRVQIKENDKAHAELKGTIEKERAEHKSQIEKLNQEVEARLKGEMCQFSIQSCCDDSQLRLLPCLHSACKPCLDHQATQTEENYIHCPSCGREFTMEQTTVDHVRCNEAAYKVNTDGDMKCSYPYEDHDAKALVYCHECDDKLCPDCHKLHDIPKRNRHHRVTEINQAEKIPMKQWLKEPNCRDHPGNKLELYDHTCKKAVCLTCVHGDHEYHRKQDLNQAYDVAKGQLEVQVKRQQHQLKNVTGRTKTVINHQTELETTQKRLQQVAIKVCKGVALKLLHRQKQLMEEIQESLQFPHKLVEEKLATLHDVHTSIVSTIDYTQRTLEATRREELITLTDVLQTKCDEILKWEFPEDDTQGTRILLTFQGQKALEELIDTFGGLASSLDVDDIPDKESTLQDLHSRNTQLILKEEDTRKVHEGRWRQLGEIIHRITGTVPHTSQGLRPEQLTSLKAEPEQMTSLEAEPETLTSQGVFEAAKYCILGAFVPSESPERGLCLKGYPGTMHIISGKRGSRFITCPKLQLDASRVNTEYCHVTTDGELVNSPPATQHTASGRLRRLWGTCSSTPIPLPPSPSSVNPVSPTTRYWEAHTRVGMMGEELCCLVLEVGVVEESQVDSERYACHQPRSWCVGVESCDTHLGSLCTRVYMAGKRGKCYCNTRCDTRGTQATLNCGVVLDVGRGRIGFIDIDRSVVIGKLDVEFKENLLPVFVVCPVKAYYTVNMKVVSGEEIPMSDFKKSLINEVLA